MIDNFVDRMVDGIDPQTPGAHIATRMRQLPAELLDDPTPEQAEAWLELAELRERHRLPGTRTSDGGGRRRARERIRATSLATPTWSSSVPEEPWPPTSTRKSAEGRAILNQIVDPALPAEDRSRVADEVETFTDRRVERYWQLMGVLNGYEPFPPSVPALRMVYIAALRASLN